ncbi:MAG: ATP synthase F1 subunit gamma [Candidatus Gracilibacteria bacterium]|nr:ATP synthase F1 subunit gamma [Candidatus Gracilibacteria bacterium]MDD5179183.1 ATP synthase F1 subunit gamma [Candidatus Gracilibacteria bacterium]
MSLLDLRRRLKSIRNTQKITKAMQMVSASKMKKAQDAALAGRPYAVELEKLIRNLVRSNKVGLQNRFFERRGGSRGKKDTKKILFLFFTADRGLCGAFNSNIIRYLYRREMQPNQEKAIACIGRKGMQFFKHMGGSVVAEFEGLGDKPSYLATAPITKLATDGFLKGEWDEVRLVYNHFVNTMQQEITEKILLPFTAEVVEAKVDAAKKEKEKEVEYIFEPSPKAVFDRILPRYLETIVYQSLLESNASEQSARMVAMKSATENAGELMGSLTLEMNKARQAGITTEILEIVGGAEALAD